MYFRKDLFFEHRNDEVTIMALIETKKIRNVALLGHGSAGKTSLTEAMLYMGKCIDRLGKTTDGNTVSDYDPEEIKRGYSINTAVSDLIWGEAKINIIDTPGYLGFAGEEMQGVRVADSAIIVLDAKSGIEVGTELAWDYADGQNIPRAFFINKCDDPEADFDRIFKGLHAKFGNALCPVFIPIKTGDGVVMIDLMDMKAYKYESDGSRTEIPTKVEFASYASQYKDAFNEAIAQTSDTLLDKYFNGEEITHDEAVEALHTGIITGSIVPVYCGSAVKMWGVRALLDAITQSFPRHTAKKFETVVSESGELVPYEIKPDGETALFVFKTVVDPFIGKMSFFKVMNGTLKKDASLKNNTSGATEKIAKIYTVKGKKQTEVSELACGDIGMLAKLAGTNTGDTLTNIEALRYAPIKFPVPNMCMAVMPLAKGDEDKISQGITRLLEEDYTVKFENNAETKQMLIYGMGDIHLDVIVSKLKNRFGTSVKLETPIIPYRETITKTVEVEGKYKKQTGGHGQYGHVKIRFSPGETDGLTFTESTVGGSVPKNFHPAVEKGLQEAMTKGVAGYPVVKVKADLFDGSYHDVDSSEMSFKLAAALAFKECMRLANPVLLEPVGLLKVTVPDAVIGDAMSDINKRRGIVMGMNAAEKKAYTTIEAEVPKAEMVDYTIALRAMTQGRGKYTFDFIRYDKVPAEVAQKIIDAYKAKNEE